MRRASSGGGCRPSSGSEFADPGSEDGLAILACSHRPTGLSGARKRRRARPGIGGCRKFTVGNRSRPLTGEDMRIPPGVTFVCEISRSPTLPSPAEHQHPPTKHAALCVPARRGSKVASAIAISPNAWNACRYALKELPPLDSHPQRIRVINGWKNFQVSADLILAW